MENREGCLGKFAMGTGQNREGDQWKTAKGINGTPQRGPMENHKWDQWQTAKGMNENSQGDQRKTAKEPMMD